MPDIRSFFAAKGGAAPPKPAAAKPEPPAKGKRTRRNVVDDSDDEEVKTEYGLDLKLLNTNVANDSLQKQEIGSKTFCKEEIIKRPSGDADGQSREAHPKGVTISADDYFASSRSARLNKTESPKRTTPRAAAKTETPTRSSTRGKPAAPKTAAPPAKKATASHKKAPVDEDGDAYMEDGDEDGDDIFAANAKGRSRRKNDDYEEDSEDEDLPQPRRVTTRRRSAASNDSAEFVQSFESVATNKKRKSPLSDSEEEEQLEAPRKKATTSKPRAPRAKKSAEPEDADIQNILDSVVTVRAPTPPPKDPNVKFDWRKAAAGGNASAAPVEGAADLPEGAEECLSGLSFVFTGVLRTIGRDEAQALVKRYGGKVTGQPSSKTSFVVLGDDAGPSKLAKIKSHGIKTIDENGLFDLIRKLPAFGGSGKGAQKAQEKKKAEEEKIQQQIAEMEAEEKAKRLEAEKVAKRKASASRGIPEASSTPARPSVKPELLLTSKYAPTQINQICGNKGQVEKIQNWLRNWPKSKKYNFQRRGADGMGGERAIIISGPPGIGKTTAAHLAARLEGYDVLESNASDTRSKKLVESGVSDVMNNTSLLGFFAGDGKSLDASKKKIVLVMDEVDGMSAGDRGGVGALAKFCRKTEVPLILICNERKLPKMKPFDHVAYDIRFNRPTVDQVRSRIMTICHREGLKLPPPVVDALIEGSNKDIRQIINMIATAKLDQSTMSFDQSKEMSKAWEKHVILKPWDICQKMLAGGLFSPASKSTLNDKIELYFNDHEFSYLMIQENYLRSKASALNNRGYNRRQETLKTLELFDQAAESISDGDLVDRMIHGPQQHWTLMPTHAVFSTVRPASFVAGQLIGSNFTSWLGNNSKAGKLGRYVRELHSHMRLRTSGDHNEIRQQYMPLLWSQTVDRLQNEGGDSVGDVIELMDSYFLTREDFDALQELGVGPMSEEKVSIETKTKAAFTRTYNAMSHPIPFIKASTVNVPRAAPKEMPDLEEAIEEEDEAAVEAAEAPDAEDEEIDFKKDKYIKQPKAKKTATTTKKATKKGGASRDDDGNDDDDNEDKDKGATGKPKGRPKAGAAGARGRVKK